MSYPDRDLNLATDSRTNAPIPFVDFTVRAPSDLAKLRSMWASLPSVPKLLASRDRGEDVSWPGFEARTLLRGDESSGRWSFVSLVVAPGSEFPAHGHEVGDTYWFVLEGEVELTVGSVTSKLTGPSFAFVPEQTTQALVNRSGARAVVYVGYAPAGAERAFHAAHRLWKQQPDARAEAYREVFLAHGFKFTNGAPLPNDARTNLKVPRVDADIHHLDDYQKLRARWAKLTPVPKLVPDVKTCLNIPITNQETRVMLNPEEARGGASVFFGGLEKGFGAPPHHQPSEEEFFIVLKGPLSLTVGNETEAQAQPGAFGFAPRFATHNFMNFNDDRTFIFTINSPAGHDRGFELAVKESGTPNFGEKIGNFGFQFHQSL